ncbi:MAG TPA: indole-3-glycerol phosphate synthase TrpC [Gemmatimonadaceae bacterium]|nr:indole-3-glycerol phosphate synthase TrpC [Gemmatimonadaceae bacterium]
MQATPAWTPPAGTLGGIISEAQQRATALRRDRGALERAAAAAGPVPSFAGALRQSVVSVIAEVKRRSPSKGWINPGISAAAQARSYESGGAAAISVLTEREHFGGSNEDLMEVRSAVRVPVLKKDFHVDPIQLVEAKALGASAALLIVRALAPETLAQLSAAGTELGLELLFEVRDRIELSRAMEAGARIIGVNNRNLETLVIDPTTAERLINEIPADCIAIGESGVSDRSDVERLARAGADAVLVGSAVSAAEDPTATVRDLSSVKRVGRGA